MKFRAAKKLLWKAGRSIIIGAAAVVVALAVMWDKMAAFAGWVFR